MQNIHIIQILSGIGAGKYGSEQGVKQLCQGTRQAYPTTPFENPLPHTPALPPAKHIHHLVSFFTSFVPPLTALYQQPAFPVILSGDHANAIGTVSALCNAYPDKRIGVIWIDAHADLHTPYTTPSGNVHGMSLAALLRQDNRAEQIHSLSPEIQTAWQQLKQLAPTAAGILPQDLCFLGLRDYEPQERALIDALAIPHYSCETIRQQGLDQVLATVKQQASQADLLYISFDVDALDASLIQSTGTPVAQGFSEQEVAQILHTLLALPTVAVFEMTEFNPTLCNDPQEHARIARLLDGALAQIARR